MAKYRKKPVVIEAMLLTEETVDEVIAFIGKEVPEKEYPGELAGLVIETLEGEMTARIGDYIIKGVNGEFYPCKPDIFEKTYDPV